MSAFEELGLMPELIRACEEEGWLLPTPVQAEAVPLILGGGDVMAGTRTPPKLPPRLRSRPAPAAETGSGKTAAFALPVLQLVHEAIAEERRAAASAAGPSARPAAAAAAPADVRMSMDDRDAMLAIAPDGLLCQARSEHAWAGCRASAGVASGVHYFEVEVRDEGLVRLGWASAAGARALGTDAHSFGFGGAGMKSHANVFTPYGSAFGAGAVVGALLDCERGELSFSLAGQPCGAAFQLPAALRGATLFPALYLKNAEARVNFGSRPFVHAAPDGALALHGSPALRRAAPRAPPPVVAGGARTPRALVLEPVRDLAEQTAACLTRLGASLTEPALSTVLVVGGVDPGPALRALRAGADVAVGTPAKLLDMVRSGKLDLRAVRFFVLDEADRLLEPGESGADAVLALFRALPRAAAEAVGAARLQVLLFSATLHAAHVLAMGDVLCDGATWVDLKGRDFVPDCVHHAVLLVEPAMPAGGPPGAPAPPTDNVHAVDAPGGAGDGARLDAASAAIKRQKPLALLRLLDAHAMDQVMVFCRTNFDCDNLERFLVAAGGGRAARLGAESGKENPYSCAVLAGSRSQDERRRALAAFKDGAVRLLVCTDVAARGIDVAGLPFVVNMTLPDTAEEYIHRIGRVGRADCLGLAVSLVASVPERVWYVKKKGAQPWLAPTAADVAQHSVWLDEMAAVAAIEERLGAQLARMGPDAALPEALLAALPEATRADGMAAYGKPRGDASAVQTAAPAGHAMAPTVAALSALETKAQRSFWAFKRNFATFSSG